MADDFGVFVSSAEYDCRPQSRLMEKKWPIGALRSSITERKAETATSRLYSVRVWYCMGRVSHVDLSMALP
ncbi:hypothetical protein EVAR_12281_1 [Eumeta japonica]|uniref:Uncharacterized protein n=1 Tax=Eumeta variegata TaxID=151549 RepID=A0A4C1TU73_EUMVA|nr:hypothetical protein EVAR_12281_1 [Eumeta japonica]